MPRVPLKPFKFKGTRNLSSGYFIQTAALLAACTIFMLTAGAIWITGQAKSMLDERDAQNRSAQAIGLGLAVTEALAMNDFGAIESRLIQALSNQNLQEAIVTDLQGNILAFVRTSPDGPEPVFQPNATVTVPSLDQKSREILVDNQVYQRWQHIEAGTPLGWLRISSTDEETRLSLRRLGQQTLLLTVIMATLMLTAFGIILRRAYRVIAANELQLRQSNLALQDAADKDPLTQLPNRAALMRAMHGYMAQADSASIGFAVCFLDLDGFKPINDTYGHDFGDEVLRIVAGRLQSTARQEDYPARIGGDEFILIVSNIDNASELGPVMSRLIHAISAPIHVGDTQVSVGLSVGASMFPADGKDALTLLGHADQAMYQAKRQGGRCAVVWEVQTSVTG